MVCRLHRYTQTDRQTERERGRLTREDGGHHGGEHEEEQAKEEKTGVVVGLGRLVADVEIEQTNQNAADHVTSQS